MTHRTLTGIIYSTGRLTPCLGILLPENPSFCRTWSEGITRKCPALYRVTKPTIREITPFHQIDHKCVTAGKKSNKNVRGKADRSIEQSESKHSLSTRVKS